MALDCGIISRYLPTSTLCRENINGHLIHVAANVVVNGDNKNYRNRLPAAVGTVQKIARDIAKAEDKKNLVKYVKETQTKAAAFSWNTMAALPAPQNWLQLAGGDIGFKSQIISDIGDDVEAAAPTHFTAADAQQLEVRVHGIEVRGIVRNNSIRATRVEIRLLWIPNINSYTDSVINYLQPRLTMFHKSGKGVGSLLFQGYNKRALAVYDATGVPIKFTTLARKVIMLPQATTSGTLTAGPAVEAILLAVPTFPKRFTMKKYFKTPKRHFIRGDQTPMSDGNYYLCYWTDGSSALSTCSLLVDTLMQYSIKAPMKAVPST